MINAIMSLARAHYEHTGKQFTHLYMGPRAYAALEQEVKSKYGDLVVDMPVCMELQVAGLIVHLSSAEGMLFR